MFHFIGCLVVQVELIVAWSAIIFHDRGNPTIDSWVEGDSYVAVNLINPLSLSVFYHPSLLDIWHDNFDTCWLRG